MATKSAVVGCAESSNLSVRLVFRVGGVALLAFGCAQSTSTAQVSAPVTVVASQPPSQAVLDRKALSDFRRNVDQYMKLRNKAQRRGTRQAQKADVGEHVAANHVMASRIRRERDDAEQGDILTPIIGDTLRTFLNPSLRSQAGAGTRESIRDDGPATFVLEVNGDYPDGESRSTMPANVLGILPPLPTGLQYRIVGTHLVLMDVDAYIVVDYLLDVMCVSC
jgi:hypothetical protein